MTEARSLRSLDIRVAKAQNEEIDRFCNEMIYLSLGGGSLL